MQLEIKFTEEAQRKVQATFEQILQVAGQKAVETAVELAPARGEGPYSTGRLRESIRGQMTGENEFTIFCPMSYGVYLEFGTGPKGQVSGAMPDFPDDPDIQYHNGEVLVTRWRGRLLEKPYIRHTQGMFAAPFMRPALLEGLKWIERLLKEL